MTGAAPLGPLREVWALGGPVVALLIVVSVVTLALVLAKIWQFRAAGVGQHRALRQALGEWDGGEARAALGSLAGSPSYLAPVLRLGVEGAGARRLETEAEARFARLERGFRLLDSVVQLAPLLGLFGTVLGMIEAFQALQEAGAQVDPSVLAGGIWVSLLTTAVGLAVAMPTSLALSWFEGRMQAERVLVDEAIARLTAPAPQGQAFARAG
jgi:biopolymer transport protein ExbB